MNNSIKSLETGGVLMLSLSSGALDDFDKTPAPTAPEPAASSSSANSGAEKVCMCKNYTIRPPLLFDCVFSPNWIVLVWLLLGNEFCVNLARLATTSVNLVSQWTNVVEFILT